MYFLGLIISFFWGIGQNLPYENIYLYGIGPGDFIFLIYILFALIHPRVRAVLMRSAYELRNVFYLISAFILLTLLSFIFNSINRGFYVYDIIEVFRPYYYFLLVVFIATCTSRFGIGVLLAFMLGILVTGIVAFMKQYNIVMGFPVLWNPNVIGNMLSIGIVFSSLLILEKRIITALLFIIAYLILAIFTYSKGAWIMSFLGLLACIIAAFGNVDNSKRELQGKLVFAIGMAVILILAIPYYDDLSQLVRFKIGTSQIGDSAAEGGTIAARWGFVIASFTLAVGNPIFGVGISNFESAYNSLQSLLGNNYWESDDPHSAWLYVMACIGFPALVVFIVLVLYPLRRLASKTKLRPVANRLYILSVAAVFILSGAVMLQLLTQYFMWFFMGVVLGWQQGRLVIRGTFNPQNTCKDALTKS